MNLVEYRGDDSATVNYPLPKVGSIGMIVGFGKEGYKVEFPYRCFDEIVEEEELIVTLAKSQFVDANHVFLDGVNEWAERETARILDEFMDFMREHGDDREGIKEIFGEKLSEKMFTFYEENK